MFCCPFRIFANDDLGTAFNYAAFTEGFVKSESTGAFAVLPEVNVATGNLILPSLLINTQESFGDFSLGYVYNAHNRVPWSLSIPEIISVSDTVMVYKTDDGTEVSCHFDPALNAYLSPSGGAASFLISKDLNTGLWRKLNPDTGAQTLFSPSGKIEKQCNLSGFSASYVYEDNQLKSVLTDAGVYSFDRESTGFLKIWFEESAGVSKNTDTTDTTDTKRKCLATWQLGDQGRVTAAFVGDTASIHYAYGDDSDSDKPSPLLKSVKQSDGTCLSFAYTDNKITSLQQGSGDTRYQFSYLDHQTDITDPLGFSHHAFLNQDLLMQDFVVSMGDTPKTASFFKIHCDYDAKNNLQAIQKDDGSLITRAFNAAGLVLQVCGANGQVTEYDYDDFDPNLFVLLNKRVGVGADKQDHFSVSRFVYDTFQKEGLRFSRLRFSIAETGAVSEYRYDDHHKLVSKRTYLANPFPIETYTEKSAISLEAMEDWVSKQPLDQITLETFEKNNRNQCEKTVVFTKIDKDGNGVKTAETSIQGKAYTPSCLITLLSSNIDLDNTAITTQRFDDLNRLRSHTDALGCVRAIDINEALHQQVITEPNGLYETHIFNDAGKMTDAETRIPGSEDSRQQKFFYDAKGRVIAIKNSDLQFTYQLFDSLNRLRYTITPMGRVSEIIYDDQHRFQKTVHYYHALSTPLPTLADLFALSEKQKNEADADKKESVTYQFFDKSHRLQFEIDGRGALTEHRYDRSNLETAVIVYADFITPDEIIDLQKNCFSRLPNPSKDEISKTVYDEAGRVLITQDPEGYITQNTYNAAGFLIYQRQYAKKQVITADHTITLPEKTKQDFGQYFYHDKKGQIILTVDDVEEGRERFVVSQSYHPNGKIKSEIKYAQPTLLCPDFNSVLSDLTPKDNDEDQKTDFSYDALDRLIKTIFHNGRIFEKQFDEMGNCVKENEYDEKARVASRIIERRFDLWGKLTALVPPLLREVITAIEKDTFLTAEAKQTKIDLLWKNHAER